MCPHLLEYFLQEFSWLPETFISVKVHRKVVAIRLVAAFSYDPLVSVAIIVTVVSVCSVRYCCWLCVSTWILSLWSSAALDHLPAAVPPTLAWCLSGLLPESLHGSTPSPIATPTATAVPFHVWAIKIVTNCHHRTTHKWSFYLVMTFMCCTHGHMAYA